MAEQPLLLFDKPGVAATSRVQQAVQQRLESGGIAHLVIASVTGRTALRMAQAVSQPGLSVVCVTGPPSWDTYGYDSPRPSKSVHSQLEDLRVTVVNSMISSFGDTVEYSAARFGLVPSSWLIAETLVSVGGYGLKTAVEASVMATDAGAIPPFIEVIAVGGTNRGADTAAVVVSTFAARFFSLQADQRFQVKEILAMPRNKTWYQTVVCADWRVQERKRQSPRSRRS